MTSGCAEKLKRAKEIVHGTGGCAVAFSGGVDSTLVLTIAREVLGPRCLAVIARSSTYPARELAAAVKWVEDRLIPHEVIVSEELDIPEFADNPPDRCYHCKRELYAKIRSVAAAHGLSHVADGANADDEGDFRPGMRAAREMGVISPLKGAGLTKSEVRTISKEVYDLPTADKPSMACLSSRFPYGSRITRDKLKQVEEIEDYLYGKGFRVIRARHHGDVLRLELGPEEMRLTQRADTRVELIEFAKSRGFTYVTIDLEGFRSGSMNETLSQAGTTGDRSTT